MPEIKPLGIALIHQQARSHDSFTKSYQIFSKPAHLFSQALRIYLCQAIKHLQIIQVSSAFIWQLHPYA